MLRGVSVLLSLPRVHLKNHSSVSTDLLFSTTTVVRSVLDDRGLGVTGHHVAILDNGKFLGSGMLDIIMIDDGIQCKMARCVFLKFSTF